MASQEQRLKHSLCHSYFKKLTWSQLQWPSVYLLFVELFTDAAESHLALPRSFLVCEQEQDID